MGVIQADQSMPHLSLFTTARSHDDNLIDKNNGPTNDPLQEHMK